MTVGDLDAILADITPEQFALFRGYLAQIHAAREAADRAALDRLAAHVPTALDLTEAQRDYLRRAAAR